MKKFLLFIAIGFWALCVHAQQAETRVALVIGNSAYKNSPLKNPVNDATDMAARLKGFGFSVIERNNLTTKQIGSTLREFRSKLTPGSVALVFYAGHGVTIKGKNYLPAVDAEINGEEDVPNQSLGTEQIMDVLAEAKTRLNLVFLDACRDNPYARGFRSSSRGLSKENAPSGTLISFATKPGSVAADGTGRNGLYTSVLLEQIKNTGQPIEQVLKRVVTGVRTASKNQQEPWMEGSIEGDFCFGSCSQNVVIQAPAELSETQKEDGFWADAKAAGNVKAFEAYVKKYPNGRYIDLAKANIERLSIPISSNSKPPSNDPTPGLQKEAQERENARRKEEANALANPSRVSGATSTSGPIKFVVPFAPGGHVDLIARAIATKLSESTGQTVIVENKPGAGGLLGTDAVAKSPADGKTFLFTNSVHATSPSLKSNLPFDPLKDFKPVILMGTEPMVFVTSPDARIKSLPELVALAKKGTPINFGSGGVGGLNHLAVEAFSNAQNIKLNHIPYRGEAPMLIDLVSGQMDFGASFIPNTLPYIKTGKMRPLAVSGQKRSPELPEVPTLKELGLSNTPYVQWWAVFAPANTPQPIVLQMNEWLSKILNDPASAKALMATYPMDIVGGTPDVLQAWNLAEMNRWSRVIRENQIKQ